MNKKQGERQLTPYGQRLNEVREKKTKFNKREFASHIDVSNNTLLLAEKSEQNEFVTGRLIKKFPEINYQWLTYGHGTMEENALSEPQEMYNQNLKKEIAHLHEMNAQLTARLGDKEEIIQELRARLKSH